MGVDNYQQTQERTEAPRAAEYRNLVILNAELQKAKDAPKDVKHWAEAIMANQQFWSRMRVHVLNANTSLPDEMRLQFIQLAGWVEKESALVASGTGDIEQLIAVNQQIMEGLKPYTGSLQEGTLQAAV